MKIFDSTWKILTNTNAIKSASGLSSYDCTVAYSTYSTIVKSLLILLGCGELWSFFSSNWSLDAITDGLNVILIQFGALYKYKVLMRHKKEFRQLASSMESENFDLSTRRRKMILEVWTKRNDATLKLMLGLGTCTVIVCATEDTKLHAVGVTGNKLVINTHIFCRHIYPLMDDLDYNLMVAIRLPFDYKTPTLYAVTYICTLIVFSYISYFVMANDLIVQAHLMHLLCQFAVLNDCFKNILKDCQSSFQDVDTRNLHLNKEFTKIYKNRLGKLVEQHQLILNNTMKLRVLMSTPMLIQLAVSTALICSIGFQIATSLDVNMTKGLMSLFYLGYNMFVLYILCRWCEEIKIQSQKIGDALYCSGWENGIVMVPGVRTSILLILARANKPTSLSAGGMYELSLEAYSNMVKTSYSALTVLLRLR